MTFQATEVKPLTLQLLYDCLRQIPPRGSQKSALQEAQQHGAVNVCTDLLLDTNVSVSVGLFPLLALTFSFPYGRRAK